MRPISIAVLVFISIALMLPVLSTLEAAPNKFAPSPSNILVVRKTTVFAPISPEATVIRKIRFADDADPLAAVVDLGPLLVQLSDPAPTAPAAAPAALPPKAHLRTKRKSPQASQHPDDYDYLGYYSWGFPTYYGYPQYYGYPAHLGLPRMPLPLPAPRWGEMARVQTLAGPVTVALHLASPIQDLIADFVAAGYVPRRMGCLAFSGHVPNSRHYAGAACDFDQYGWGLTVPFMYTQQADEIIRAHGFRNGCSFNDCGHIDDGLPLSPRRHQYPQYPQWGPEY